VLICILQKGSTGQIFIVIVAPVRALVMLDVY